MYYFSTFFLVEQEIVFIAQFCHAASNSMENQMSSFLTILFHLEITQCDTNYCAVIGLIFYWACILNFCFSFFWAVPALRPGGIAPHLVPLIWLVILALHLDHSLAKLTATCVLPRNNPKQIQTNPCAISKYWSTTVQDLALKTRIFSAIS